MTSRVRSAGAVAPRQLPAAQRWSRLLERLAADGRIDVVEAAADLRVAQETIRRDLRALEARGELLRVHGGAVPLEAAGVATDGVGVPGLPGRRDDDDRALLAQLWAGLPRWGTLLLGTGRLALELGHLIAADPPTAPGLTVVTNSLDVGLVVSRASRVSVYNIGGTVSPLTRAQEGDWALTELQRLHTDVSVVSPAGISLERGLSQPTPAAAAVSQAEVAAGERVVVLLEATALGRDSFVTFARLSEVDALVVAGHPAPSLLAPFVERGLPCSFSGVDGRPTSAERKDGHA